MHIDLKKIFLPSFIKRHKNKHKEEEETCVLSQIEHRSDKMVIIGNGPSLNRSIDKYYSEILACDKMVVNEFGATDLFEKLKPGIYVLADPAYFTLPDDFKDSVLSLFDKIASKVTWPMRVIVPLRFKGAKSLDILSRNDHICFDFYFDRCRDVGKKTKFEAWDENLIEPPAQTVLNTCLYLSLYWNYKETYLIGADTSFLESLRIDQETNDIYIAKSHFYQDEEVYEQNYYEKDKGAKMTGWTLHDLIWAYGNMFKMYAELKEYADYKGLKVYNASEYSWINVFERKKVK